MSTAVILAEDTDFFARLPEAARREALFWSRIMARLEAAAVQHGIGKALAAIAAQYFTRRGFSAKTLRRKWDRWNKTRHVTALLDRAKFPALLADAAPALPGEFLEFWKGLQLERQRGKVAAAHRELVRRWQDWRKGNPLNAIPGYETCPPADPQTEIPEGWSYRNLKRFQPTDVQRAGATRGRAAAAEYRLQTFTTRAGLRVGQYYLFDDIWHDNKVNVPGERAAQRPLELHAIDLFSGCKFAWGLQPSRLNEETQRMEMLKQKEMLWLVAAILIRDGYHPDGTTFIVEHQTAAIRAALEAMLSDLTRGAVKVERGGIEGASAFAGQYEGRGKGNFRFKAALESLGNLIHNEMDALPGQVGRNRDHAPAELHGLERHNDALLCAVAQLPEAVRDLLAFPVPTFAEFKRIAAQIYQNINTTPLHRLEGWEEAGLMAHEWRLDPRQEFADAAALLQLPAEERRIAEALIEANPALRRVRRLSRAEVWERGRHDLVRLPVSAMPLLLGADNAAPLTVEGNHFSFERFELGPGEHRYVALARDGQGSETLLRNGQTYLTYVTPFWPEMLVACDPKGRFIGACLRDHTPTRADAEAIRRRMALARHLEAEQLAPIAVYRRDLAERRTEIHRHNAAVLGHVNRVRRGQGKRLTPAAAARFAGEAERMAAPASSPAAPARFDGNDLL